MMAQTLWKVIYVVISSGPKPNGGAFEIRKRKKDSIFHLQVNIKDKLGTTKYNNEDKEK